MSFGEFLLLRTPLRLVWAGQERATMFFVLSGFVLCLPWLNGNPQSYGRFLLGRLCRIYPPYITAMALAALASVLIGGQVLPKASIYFNELGWARNPDAGTLPSVLLVLTNHHSDYINEAVWSLTWEVRVAILFPLLMLPLLRWRNIGAAQGLCLSSAFRPGGHAFLLTAHPDLAELLGNGCRYTGCFVLGTIIAMNRVRIGEWFDSRHPAFGWLCLSLGLWICWSPWPHFHDQIVGIGASLIIVAIIGTKGLKKWLAKEYWLWLGRQSYSLYLIHVPVVMVIVILMRWESSMVGLSLGYPSLHNIGANLPSPRGAAPGCTGAEGSQLRTQENHGCRSVMTGRPLRIRPVAGYVGASAFDPPVSRSIRGVTLATGDRHRLFSRYENQHQV
jgi:peptidoglycan/LPS O-acetylase OafA/YrhL